MLRLSSRPSECNGSQRFVAGGLPNRDSLPAEVLCGCRWVGYRSEPRRTGKPTKRPIDAATGRAASVTDPKTWGTFDAAVAAAVRYGLTGIGRVVVPGDGLSFLDLDGCREPRTGHSDPWAAEILATFKDTYAEISPSGTGYRAVVAGHPPAGTPCKAGPVECYTRSRFLTFTGQRLDDHPIAVADAGDRLNWLAGRFLRPPASPRPAAPAHAFNPITLSDGELLRRATAHPQTGPRLAALFAGEVLDHRSPSEADYELARLLGYWSGGDAERVLRLMWASDAARDKWAKNRSYLRRTVACALSRLSRVYDPASPLTTPKRQQREDKECATGMPLPYDRPNGNLDRLVGYVRQLRLAHGRPVGLSVRQAGELLSAPPRTAARLLNALVRDGRLDCITKGNYRTGLASVFDLPELASAPASAPTPTTRSHKPAQAEGVQRRRPPLPPPHTHTPGGLTSVWWYSTRSKRWLDFGSCPGQDKADALAGRLMPDRPGWWAVGNELRHYVRGRGLQVMQLPAAK